MTNHESRNDTEQLPTEVIDLSSIGPDCYTSEDTRRRMVEEMVGPYIDYVGSVDLVDFTGLSDDDIRALNHSALMLPCIKHTSEYGQMGAFAIALSDKIFEELLRRNQLRLASS